MTNLVRRLHLLLTTDSESLPQIEFLLAQLRMARAKFPGPVPLTPAEKAELLKLGKPLGAAAKELVAIVTPRTFTNWVNAEKSKSAEDTATVGTKGGRPRIKIDVREMIARCTGRTNSSCLIFAANDKILALYGRMRRAG